MAYQSLWQDNLPWSDTEEDRKLTGYIAVALIVSTLFFIVVQFLPLMAVKERELKDVAPRLAKLIIEKQSQPKPPPPLPKQKKKTEKPKPKPKPKQKTEKPKPVPKPVPNRTQVAKKQAQKHITAIQDALADLRDFDVASIENSKPTRSASNQKSDSNNTTSVIAARAKQGSGGINTQGLSRATGSGNLQGRQTTAVSSNLGSGAQRGSRSGGSGQPSRPYEEIELVFQKNKGRIFSLYNRALRKDPTLQGKIVVELTIAPSGKVTKVRIVSSELKNKELERKLVARIKLFRFKPGNVDTLIVKYPIDFLPT